MCFNKKRKKNVELLLKYWISFYPADVTDQTMRKQLKENALPTFNMILTVLTECSKCFRGSTSLQTLCWVRERIYVHIQFYDYGHMNNDQEYV